MPLLYQVPTASYTVLALGVSGRATEISVVRMWWHQQDVVAHTVKAALGSQRLENQKWRVTLSYIESSEPAQGT